MFKICARTVLELGSELISSDVIAFYELIKNAFDAGSPTGAEIHFEIVLRRNKYLSFRQRAISGPTQISALKSEIRGAMNLLAPEPARLRFDEIVQAATDAESLVEALDRAYAAENRIVVSDKGSGMSRRDLVDNYLVIGTASRKRAIDEALHKVRSSKDQAPFLGEKGIGRLSAMRLGDTLTVETARREDQHLNLLEIDWSAFDDLDAMLDQIEVKPQRGGPKPDKDWNGTRLILGQLTSDWTQARVKRLADNDFARLTDPFAPTKSRPRIAVFWNCSRVPVGRMDRRLLEHAHASATGTYRHGKDGPVLECQFEALNLGFEHPREKETRFIALPDLDGSICGTSGEVPASALTSVGAFGFETYWFNRRRLEGIDGIGDQKAVRDLQHRWSGILLYRDRFRVLPYGEDEDDWLALDRKALASIGYLLNKNQFVGRVIISRLGNPDLIDQTNREGLRVCPEQEAFIELLKLAIQAQFREFLRDVQKRHKDQPDDLEDAKTDVKSLEKRAKEALRRIRRMAPDASDTLEELQHMFFEIKEFFDRAQQRITEVESENQQMVQMAGVGLLVEVVAHELARSTENTLAALESLRGEAVPAQVEGLLEALRAEMKSVNKRIRVLDPLSVSGRQRRETFDLVSLVEDVLSGHVAQFDRHHVQLDFVKPRKAIPVKAVKGMFVQILENLLSNSLYWLDIRRERDSDFQPSITVGIEKTPLTLRYEDNGRGVAPENREKVFRAFFSLKEKSKRRGLGLFIARECAEYHDGTLTLDEHVNRKTGRLHRFILELPDKLVVS